MVETISEFVHDLQELRTQAGAPSYRELAKRTGIPRATLHDALRGERLPTLDTTLKIVTACGGQETLWRQRWCAVHHATTTAAHPDDTSGPEPARTTTWWKRQPGRRRRLITAAIAVVALTTPITILILRAASGQPCTQVREYTVTDTGSILDRNQNVIGDVQPGDRVRVRVRNQNTGPFPHRYEATVLRTGQTGYIDQAKLDYINTVCS